MRNTPLFRHTTSRRTLSRANPHERHDERAFPRPKATTLAVLGYVALIPALAHANCATSGSTTTCDTTAPSPWTSMVGTGPTTASNSQVIVGPNAQIVVGNSSAIEHPDRGIGHDRVRESLAELALADAVVDLGVAFVGLQRHHAWLSRTSEAALATASPSTPVGTPWRSK